MAVAVEQNVRDVRKTRSHGVAKLRYDRLEAAGELHRSEVAVFEKLQRLPPIRFGIEPQPRGVFDRRSDSMQAGHESSQARELFRRQLRLEPPRALRKDGEHHFVDGEYSLPVAVAQRADDGNLAFFEGLQKSVLG